MSPWKPEDEMNQNYEVVKTEGHYLPAPTISRSYFSMLAIVMLFSSEDDISALAIAIHLMQDNI